MYPQKKILRGKRVFSDQRQSYTQVLTSRSRKRERKKKNSKYKKGGMRERTMSLKP
jgi:hypothetical protein